MKSKFSYLQVYGLCIFYISLLVFSIVILFHPHLRLRLKGAGTFSSLSAAILFSITSVIGFYLLFKKAFFLKIDQEEILIKSIFFNLVINKKDIQSVDLDTKESVYLFGKKENVTVVTLRKKIRIVIVDKFYSNIHGLKSSLKDFYDNAVKPRG